MVLYITNTLGIVFTLGLFIPWAAVRMARYRAERTTFLSRGNLDDFVNKQAAQVASAGDELGEMLDLEVAI